MPKIEDVEVSEMDQGDTVAPEHRAVTPAPHTQASAADLTALELLASDEWCADLATVSSIVREALTEIKQLRAQVEEWKAKHEDRSKLNHRRAEIIENLRSILSDHKSAEWQVLSAARAALSAAKGET